MTTWFCSVCGQEFEAEPTPTVCPICGAGEDAIEAVK